MGRGPKYFSLQAIDCTTGEGMQWRVGKFKPLFLTKRKHFFLPFSLKESQCSSNKKPFNKKKLLTLFNNEKKISFIIKIDNNMGKAC